MPKTNLCARPQPGKEITRLIFGRMASEGVTADRLAEKMSDPKRAHRCQTSRSTIYKRKQKPEDWTIGELISAGSALDIPIDELRAAIRY